MVPCSTSAATAPAATDSAAAVNRASVIGWVSPAASHPLACRKSAEPPSSARTARGGLATNGMLTAIWLTNEENANRIR